MFQVLVLVLAGVAVLLAGVVLVGAALSLLLSTPQNIVFSAAPDAAGRPTASLSARPNAWAAPYSEASPAAPLYWLSTGVAAAGAATATTAAVR